MIAAGANTDEWDGNQIAEYPLTWTAEDVAAGRYRIYNSVDEVDADKDCGWRNVIKFVEAGGQKKEKTEGAESAEV